MNNLNFYPTLTDALMLNSKLSVSDYDFSYVLNERSHTLEQKIKSTLKITDPLEIWKVEADGLCFSKNVSIAKSQILYGENGIACSKALIGVCIKWTNRTMTQTGCILPETVIKAGTGYEYKFNHSFGPGEISGDLELSVILYIKRKADIVCPGEEILINEEGVTVGEVENVVLDFNNIYMEFPIEECYYPDKPLWWIQFSQWEDPKTDLFDKENVCIYLNTFYGACPKVGEQIKDIDILIDILSTAFLLIFNKVGENPDDLRCTRCDLNLSDNSICSVLHQFIESSPYDLCFDSSEELLKGLQINIRDMMRKEGDA